MEGYFDDGWMGNSKHMRGGKKSRKHFHFFDGFVSKIGLMATHVHAKTGV